MCNHTAERTDNVHRDNVLLNAINKRTTKNKLYLTTTSVWSEPTLEETAIKYFEQSEKNKKTRRLFQRMLVKYILLQST